MKFKRSKIDITDCTFFELLVAVTPSLLAAGRLGTFVNQWLIAQSQLGHVPSQKEFREFWGESRATVDRRFAEFRRAFPNADTPSDLPAFQKRVELGARNWTEFVSLQHVA